jgi:hypothetical protein
MKTAERLVLTLTLALTPLLAAAQTTKETNQVEQLRQQLLQLQESFRKMQEQQQQQIDALQKQIQKLQEAQPAPQKLPEALPAPSANQAPPAVVTTAPESAVTPTTPTPVPEPNVPWSPSSPITVLGGQRNYLNISFDALVAAGTSTANDLQNLELGGHDPRQRGFTVQNHETVFEGKVDPYFRGQANVVLQIDPHGDTTVEAEEAYLETMSLPANLQVKAGQFFTEFGRLNPTHPHTWDFVDQPLVNGRFLGEDGLRSAGARLSWLAPTPFYSELFFTFANSQGPTAYSFNYDHDNMFFLGRPTTERGVRTLGDMLFVPRYAASVDITDSQTIVAGTSAAFGPNSSGENTDTQIYGVDLFWKWKSPHQNAGFPFVTWQTEAMMRRFDAGAVPASATTPALPEETITDYGMYSQITYGFKKGWVTAFRGDYLFPDSRARYEEIEGPDPDRAMRWRLSPNITWYPSEFSKLRLQYNFDHRQGIGDDHSVWLQFEFLLGSHAAHKF